MWNSGGQPSIKAKKMGEIILRRIFWKVVTRVEAGHDWLRIMFCHQRIRCE